MASFPCFAFPVLRRLFQGIVHKVSHQTALEGLWKFHLSASPNDLGQKGLEGQEILH
jgi:hypothetical protein